MARKTSSTTRRTYSTSRAKTSCDASSQNSPVTSHKYFRYWSVVLKEITNIANAPAWIAITALLSIGLYYPTFANIVDEKYREFRYDLSFHIRHAKEAKKRGFKAFENKKNTEGHYYYGQVVAIYTLLYNIGYKEAGFELGKLTCVGFGTAKNPRLAKHYFTEANLSPSQKERIYKIQEFRACYDITNVAELSTQKGFLSLK